MFNEAFPILFDHRSMCIYSVIIYIVFIHTLTAKLVTENNINKIICKQEIKKINKYLRIH